MSETSLVPELSAHYGHNFEEPVAMDRRGRLAQSPTPKPKRRATAAARLPAHASRSQSLLSQSLISQAWPASSAGWRRLARRWGASVLDLKLPRGVGSSAAAILLLASASYGALKGGHVPNIAAQVQDFCDAAANSAGFGIAEIALAGEREVGRDDILTLAGITEHSSLLFLDAAKARARLLSNPWIAQATVLKLYPDRLRIEIKERDPFALWQRDGRVALIANDGTLLEPTVPRRFAGLPQVVGRGAEHAARDFIALVARYPAIANAVEASVLVAERRWNLRLKGGVEVLLPEAEPERALMTLLDLERSKKLLARDIVAVDLRLADRVSVRLSDGAAAARDAALKAAEKDKKTKSNKSNKSNKSKGSDA